MTDEARLQLEIRGLEVELDRIERVLVNKRLELALIQAEI